jgi:hypothetical protein
VGGLAEVAKVAWRVVFTVDEQDEARAAVKGQLGANTRQAKSAEVLSPEERLGYRRASMTPAERKSLTRESVGKGPSEGLIDLDDAKRLVV